MAEIFDYFCANKCLFKCDAHEFDKMIKYTMNKLIVVDTFYNIRFCGAYDTHKHTICSICLQEMNHVNCLAICCICCNICINKKVIIDFGTVGLLTNMFYYDNGHNKYQMICIDDYGNHFDIHSRCNPILIKMTILNKFFNNSPKLKYRFYHVVPIMFILSLSDPTSECYVLNHDIMIYILKFIY